MKMSNSGFTLLEILVSLVILAIGLLGLAGLLTTGLQYNLSAYHRSQATQLSYEIADRMRANVAGIAFYASIDPATATQQAGCSNTTGCSAQNMAENDLFEWHDVLANTLPSGEADISRSGDIYTISIKWDDDRDGVSANNIEFKTSMQP